MDTRTSVEDGAIMRKTPDHYQTPAGDLIDAWRGRGRLQAARFLLIPRAPTATGRGLWTHVDVQAAHAGEQSNRASPRPPLRGFPRARRALRALEFGFCQAKKSPPASGGQCPLLIVNVMNRESIAQGVGGLKAIETRYKGYRFRSRLEARRAGTPA